MRSETYATLLVPGDPPPVIIENPQGRSTFLLIGDHAGNAIPHRLGTLGLSVKDHTRHIAWDIGITALGQSLAGALDAVFIRQSYSRLVIDCNRDPASPEAILENSDGSAIAGNRGLGEGQIAARISEIHEPYQSAIAAEITRRRKAGQTTVLISLHSFTPRMNGISRPWEIGVLYDGGDTGFALALLAALQSLPELTVGDNAPYRMDATDYTVPYHAYPHKLAYAELELRQDQLATPAMIRRWSATLRQALDTAWG